MPFTNMLKAKAFRGANRLETFSPLTQKPKRLQHILEMDFVVSCGTPLLELSFLTEDRDCF